MRKINYEFKKGQTQMNMKMRLFKNENYQYWGPCTC